MRRTIKAIMLAAVLLLSLTANVAQHRKIDRMNREMQEADSLILQADDLLQQCQYRLNTPAWGRPL